MHLNDKSAAVRIHRVGMSLHRPPRRIDDEELESLIDHRSSKPDKLALAEVDSCSELLFKGFTSRAIDAVAGKH